MEKRESVQLKAFALILMFWHHLFGYGTYLTRGLEFSVVPMFGSYDAIIGAGSKICISVFAFASGYGIYKAYINDGKYSKIIKSLLKFLLQYWVIIFLIGIPYLIVYDKFNPNYLFINLFALLHNDDILYVSLSWYVKVNLLFLLASPLIKLIDKKISFAGEIFLYIVFPFLLSFVLPDMESWFCGWRYNGLSTIRLFCTWLPIFYIGVLLAKYKVFEKIHSYRSYAIFDSIISMAVMLGIVYIRALYGESTINDIFATVIFILGFDVLYMNFLCKVKIVDKVVYYIGKYSFQLWLLSGMFFFNTTEFTWVLYKPKITILILIWNIVLLFPFAVILQKIALLLYGLLEKIFVKKTISVKN